MTLEDCAKNVPKRVSKIENFLRKKLQPVQLVGLRYYETCVVDWKGNLQVRYVILTKDTLLITGNPPKTILLKVHLHSVKDIDLVADRESLIRGSEGGKEFICRHIRIFYEDNPKDDCLSDYDGSGSGSGSSTSSHEDTDSRSTTVSDMCFVDEGGDRSGGSLFRESIPSFLSAAYDPFNDLTTSLESSPPPLGTKKGDDQKNKSRSDTSEDDSSCSSLDKHDFEVKSVCSSISLDNLDEIHVRRRNNFPLEKGRAASVMDNKEVGSWSNRDDVEDNVRPQSIDISQLSSLRRRLLPSYFGRKKEEGMKIDEKADILLDGSKEVGATNLCLKELNVYLYQQSSTFLNELYLSWNKSKLSCVELDDPLRISQPEDDEDLQGTEHWVHLLEQEKTLQDAKYHNNFPLLLPVLNVLYLSLSRQYRLRRLAWNRSQLIQDLVELSHECISFERKGQVRETEDALVARIAAFGTIMEIFRLLYESCTSSFLANTDSRSTSQSRAIGKWTTSQLVRAIFSFPVLSNEFVRRQHAFEIIYNPLLFAKHDRSHNVISEAIKVVTVAHNASAALLYEILSLIHFSPYDSQKKNFLLLFKRISWDSYVKMSVTQVINLLAPFKRPLKSTECSLLYRHLYVLKTLMDQFADVKAFIQISYCEEFQYFVRWNCISEKVPDPWPLKTKLMLAFQDLRKAIIAR